MNTLAPALSTEQRASFANDGFLIVRQVIEAERIAAMQQLIDQISSTLVMTLHAEGLIADAQNIPWEKRLAAAGTHATRWGRSWRKILASPAVFQLHHSPQLLGILHDLLGAKVYGHSVYNGRPKLPQQQFTVVPWHQDAGYYSPALRDQQIVTAWMPLVDVDAHNGCMLVARGSNRTGLVQHDTVQDEAAFLKIRGEPAPGSVVVCAMQPGDILLMNNLVWHSSDVNHSDGVRWSIDCRFYGAGAELPEMYDGFPEPWLLSDLAGARPASEAEWLSWTDTWGW